GKRGWAGPRGSARPGWRGTRPGGCGTRPGWCDTGPPGPGGPAAAAGVASAPANPRTRPDTPANRAILGTMLSLAALRAIYHRRLSRDNTPPLPVMTPAVADRLPPSSAFATFGVGRAKAQRTPARYGQAAAYLPVPP